MCCGTKLIPKAWRLKPRQEALGLEFDDHKSGEISEIFSSHTDSFY